MEHVSFEQIKGQKANLDNILLALDHNLPTLLIGETGTGKTAMLYAACDKRKRNVIRINLTGQTGEDQLAGKMGLKDGETFFVEGPLTKALRAGDTVVLDEINAANAEVLFLLHSLLDDSKHIRLMDKDGEVVKAHENFRLFATMNPPEYVGTKELSPALLSRFMMILSVEYPKPSHEAKILLERCKGLPEKSAVAMVEFAVRMRKAYYAGELLHVVSTRDLISWGVLAAKMGGSHLKAFEPAILNRAIQSKTDHERMKKEAKALWPELEQHLAGVENPVSLITEALTVKHEQEMRLAEIAKAQAELEEKEKALAKYAVDKIDQLVQSAGQVSASPNPAPTNHKKVVTADHDLAVTIRQGLLPVDKGGRGLTVKQIATEVGYHFTTIYDMIKARGGKTAFLEGKWIDGDDTAPVADPQVVPAEELVEIIPASQVIDGFSGSALAEINAITDRLNDQLGGGSDKSVGYEADLSAGTLSLQFIGGGKIVDRLEPMSPADLLAWLKKEEDAVRYNLGLSSGLSSAEEEYDSTFAVQMKDGVLELAK
jgi:nitric oxide reductase NorQ protein